VACVEGFCVPECNLDPNTKPAENCTAYGSNYTCQPLPNEPTGTYGYCTR
jgi:hypothetical protein